MDSMHEDYDLLHLNISGHRFSMTKAKAKELKGTLFETLSKDLSNQINGIHYRKKRNEYFVERSPMMFDIILQYAYTGHLNRPEFVCNHSLDEELAFWRLQNFRTVLQCCSKSTRHLERANSRPAIDCTENNATKSIFVPRVGGTVLRRKLDVLWRFCEDPESSKKALIFNLICILSILVSIVNFVVATMPHFHQCDDSAFLSNTMGPNSELASNSSNSAFTSNNVQKLRYKKVNEKFSSACDGGLIFDLVELACIIWFTIELTLRCISCPNKWAFIKSPMNIIDFLATFPFYVEMAVWACGVITDLSRTSSVSSVLLMLRVLRILRAFRVLRLARYFDSLQIMGETLWESRRDMGLLVMFLGVGVLLFSTILFYVEKDVDGTAFTSIPAAFWWAIVTLTTTGYGDMTPQTSIGKICSGIACISGILILAFPVSILVEHFRHAYAERRKKMISDVQAKIRRSSILDAIKHAASNARNDQAKATLPLITVSNYDAENCA